MNTLNWNQPLRVNGSEEIQAFLWSRTCFKLILIPAGISRPLGTGTEIQTQVLELETASVLVELFLLESYSLSVHGQHKDYWRIHQGLLSLLGINSNDDWDLNLKRSVSLYDDVIQKKQTITKIEDNHSFCMENLSTNIMVPMIYSTCFQSHFHSGW